MKKKYFLYSIFLALIGGPCMAQQKYEREYSIRQNSVPEKAKDFVSSVFKNVKIHWYAEESLTGKSIEAKLKDSGKRYSIEFDESGKIQDVELLAAMKQIPEKSRKILRENLDKEFSGYKVVKTQFQWSGSEKDLKQAILEDKFTDRIVTRYELVVRARKDKKQHYYEVLSEASGALISVKEIIQRNADNLIY